MSVPDCGHMHACESACTQVSACVSVHMVGI